MSCLRRGHFTREGFPTRPSLAGGNRLNRPDQSKWQVVSVSSGATSFPGSSRANRDQASNSHWVPIAPGDAWPAQKGTTAKVVAEGLHLKGHAP